MHTRRCGPRARRFRGHAATAAALVTITSACTSGAGTTDPTGGESTSGTVDLPSDGTGETSTETTQTDADTSGEVGTEETDTGDCVPDTFEQTPALLSQTGLYDDIVAKTVAADVRPFAPQYVLWTDGAAKERWVRLPECDASIIDNSDADAWELPVGATFFKQFVVDGKRIETRMLHRRGPGLDDYLFAAYAWNEDESEGMRVDGGVVDARETGHDIPSLVQCTICHGNGSEGAGGMPGRALGFSQLQLAHAMGGVTLATLVEEGWLSDPPSQETATAAGDAVDQQVLGYLHANCGNCHNDSATGLAVPDMVLWHEFGVATREDTGVFLTAVDHELTGPVQIPGATHRITSGEASTSAVHIRMSDRGTIVQMPPLGTELTDAAALVFVSDWINAL